MKFAIDCNFENLQKLIARLISISRKSKAPFAVYGSPAEVLMATFRLKPASYEQISSLKLGEPSKEYQPKAFLGALNYDGLAFSDPSLHKIYEIDGCFFWFKDQSQLRTDRQDIFEWLQNELMTSNRVELNYSSEIDGLELLEESTDQQYINDVNEILEEIISGNFYQLNYLRYFKIKNMNWDQLLGRWFHQTGPQGALLIDQELSIVSFSPEKFVNFTNGSNCINLCTYPIKGTSRRFNNKEADLRSKINLSKSKKDLAELSMIVDLMRNDFNRIGFPGSVVVQRKPFVQSYKTVHHLVSEIRAKCSNDLSFHEFCKALFPAGSITGAPKVAVMKHIKKIENRPRNFFMGNFFWWNVGVNFLSSVLIRTVEVAGENWNQDPKIGSYAAGSGIVVKSNPDLELSEIQTKCKVLTEPLATRENNSYD